MLLLMKRYEFLKMVWCREWIDAKKQFDHYLDQWRRLCATREWNRNHCPGQMTSLPTVIWTVNGGKIISWCCCPQTSLLWWCVFHVQTESIRSCPMPLPATLKKTTSGPNEFISYSPEIASNGTDVGHPFLLSNHDSSVHCSAGFIRRDHVRIPVNVDQWSPPFVHWLFIGTFLLVICKWRQWSERCSQARFILDVEVRKMCHGMV